MASLTQTTLAGIGWTSLAKGSQAVLQIVALIVLARLLSPDAFGLYSAALVVGGFCTIFSGLGVSPAIVQRPVIEDRHVRCGFTLSVLMGVATGALVFLSADRIAAFFGMPPLADLVRLMAFGFPLQGISAVAESMALRGFRFRGLALNDALSFGFGYVVLAPVLTLFGYGVYALAWAYLGQQIVRAGALLVWQRHAKAPYLDLRTVRELIWFGAGYTLAKTFNYAATQADNLVVGRWLGAAALGLYAHAYQLIAAPAQLFGQMLDRVLFPTMASIQSEPARLSRAYRGGVFLCAVVMLPAGAVIAVLAPEIVLLLLGPDWADVAVPLRILAFGLLFRTSYKISDTVVRATGAVYQRAWRQAIFAAAVFGFALIGQGWGLGGVALGTTAALGLVFLMMAQLSLRLTGMTWRAFGAAHVPGLILGAFVGAACLGAADLLRGEGTGALGIVTGGSLAAAGAAMILTAIRPQFFLGPEGERLIATVRSRTPSLFRRSVAAARR